MATFKKQFRLGMDSNIFESFSALSKKDVSGGNVAGVESPYSANNKQTVSLALLNADEQAKEISSGIIKLHNKLEEYITLGSVKYFESFNRFSTLLLQALKLNDVLSGDDLVLKKLSDILTYSYLRKNKGRFKIYSEFDDAKSVTMLVFEAARSLGLTFLNSDVEDLIQKIVFSVLYKPKEDKKEPEKKSKSPDKKDPLLNATKDDTVVSNKPNEVTTNDNKKPNDNSGIK
jgi:hypothetical protein